AQRLRPVGAKIFDMQVAGQPTLTGRSFAKLGPVVQDVVEERRRATQKPERARPHALDLALQEMRKLPGLGAIAFQLLSYELAGIYPHTMIILGSWSLVRCRSFGSKKAAATSRFRI